MARINLVRRNTSYDRSVLSYRTTLEVLSTENINKHVFVKQRIRNFIKNTFDDIFVAVATPVQMEDLDIDSPEDGTSFYRTSKIDLMSRNAGYLEEVVQAILRELQKLVDDKEALDVLITDGIYSVTADDVVYNDTSLAHVHYRIPLTAAPCGTNELFNGGANQRVGDTDASLEGWLNNSTDPVDYKFKYNIPQDSTLNDLWPPPEDKVDYAHLEVNGITQPPGEVKITALGIFWKQNGTGYAPFAEDYVDAEDPGTDPPLLVLDFVV